MKKLKFVKISLFLFVTMVLLTFCKKENNDNAEPAGIKKIAQAYTNNVVRENFEYDSKGVLLMISFFDGSGVKTEDWKYTVESDQIIEIDYDAKDRIFWKGYWILGSNGYASKLNHNYYDTLGNMDVPQSVDYTYDNDGYLIREVYKTNDVVYSTVTYTISNGSCIETKIVDSEGTITSNNQYEFESRLLKGYPDWNFNQCYTFYGKSNKNLCSKRKDLLHNTTWDFTYELDEDGYAIKRNVIRTNEDLTTSQWENKYVYQKY